MNFSCSLASAILSAATFPRPAILFSGGLNPSSSILNFVASDLYKSIGKNLNNMLHNMQEVYEL